MFTWLPSQKTDGLEQRSRLASVRLHSWELGETAGGGARTRISMSVGKGAVRSLVTCRQLGAKSVSRNTSYVPYCVLRYDCVLRGYASEYQLDSHLCQCPKNVLSVSASRGPVFRPYLINGLIDQDETSA